MRKTCIPVLYIFSTRSYTILYFFLIHCQNEFRVVPICSSIFSHFQNSNCAELVVQYLFAHLKEDGEQREGHERYEHRVVLRALLPRVVVNDGVHSCARNTQTAMPPDRSAPICAVWNSSDVCLSSRVFLTSSQISILLMRLIIELCAQKCHQQITVKHEIVCVEAGRQTRPKSLAAKYIQTSPKRLVVAHKRQMIRRIAQTINFSRCIFDTYFLSNRLVL